MQFGGRFQVLYLLQLMSEQPNIARCHSVPDGSHGSDIIEHVAFRLLFRSEVRKNLARFHYDFAKEQYARAYDPAGYVHHADKSVHLRQVAAVSAQFFPDIRNSIEPYYIHAPVCQVEQVFCHVVPCLPGRAGFLSCR